VRTVAFSPDGDYLVAGTEDGRIRVFQGRLPHENFKEKSDGLAHPAGVSAIAFRQAAPAGPKPAGIDLVIEEWELASSGNDGNVKIWEWSPSAEGIFRIRERPKWVLMGPTSEALSLSFSPQGDQIAAGDALGNVHLWDLNRESLVKLACSSIRRNLSDQEWKLYIGENIPYERTCPHLP
jgi:WD40 repeat protein